MSSWNQAPKISTVLVAVVLTLVGVFGTFIDVLPRKLSLWSYVAATVVMVAGIVTRRL